MIAQPHAKSVRNLLESAPPRLTTLLAKPWHYRRNGRYYLRLRTSARPFVTFTVSLRTTDRATAMEISQNIIKALAYFRLDKPEATWEELREQLVAIAEQCLMEAHCDGSIMATSEAYQALYAALKHATAKEVLTVDQHRALAVGKSILSAAHARLEGNSEALVKIIDTLNKEQVSDSATHASAFLSVGASQEPLNWTTLSDLYMAEHSINLKDSTRKSMLTNYKVIGVAFEAIGVTDLRTHTREDLTALREKLLDGRAESTVNNLIQKLTTVLTWAVNNDKLPKAYAAKLKITKGADSKREGFTRSQATALMEHTDTLPANSWERWALSLAAITGARVGEIAHLTKADIKQVDGFWCIDINEDGPGKSIKNKHSARLVPLVDAALGFNLAAFLQAVEAEALPSAHGITPMKASKVLNLRIQKALGTVAGGDQTLHSLRHHFAQAMKSAGVPVSFAQAVTGHSSGTITYDNYGSGIPIQKAYEAIKQGLVGDVQAQGSAQ